MKQIVILNSCSLIQLNKTQYLVDRGGIVILQNKKYDNTVYKHIQSMFIINNYNSFISTDIPRVEFKPSELIFLTDL